MKFLVLMAEHDHYARWEAMSDAEREAFFAGLQAFDDAVRQRGTMLGGEALKDPTHSRRISGPADDRVITAGPYAESVEQLGGFFLVDLPNRETTLELAARLPVELVDVLTVEEMPEEVA